MILFGVRSREAVMKAPVVSDVFNHYRGEYLPDKLFFQNALIDKFNIPKDKFEEFLDIFSKSLTKAKLIEEIGGRTKLIDITGDLQSQVPGQQTIDKLGKQADVKPTDICFVMMPFAPPIGGYFEKVYDPAVRKAGLKPLRADNEIFTTGKIIDQIWRGINQAKILVAELTSRNPNVFYELGLAHALKKPVVLISAKEEDVPFDLKHIRVIYYDVNDPFWGDKLIQKISENILSAIKNPEEALFERAISEQEKTSNKN